MPCNGVHTAHGIFFSDALALDICGSDSKHHLTMCVHGELADMRHEHEQVQTALP
jgi:hypothetical protein